MTTLIKSLTTIVISAALVSPVQATEIKNIILMIGDGMGPQQVGLLESYADLAPHSIYNGQKTALYKLAQQGVIGASLTHPNDAIVVDSACSATMLATGVIAPA